MMEDKDDFAKLEAEETCKYILQMEEHRDLAYSVIRRYMVSLNKFYINAVRFYSQLSRANMPYAS